MRKRLIAFGLLAALLSTAAPAAGRFEGDGVTLRFLAEPPGPDGRFRAALVVGLKPGWKTYWLDPGEAGIPPEFSFDGVSEMKASFPAPHRFDDGFSKSIVYSEPFAVALDGRTALGAARPTMKATLGVCQEICVPVSADLTAEFGSASEVDAAFADLPRSSSRDSGIVGASLSPDAATLTVSVRPASAAAKADLFAAGPRGWAFGAPSAVEVAGEEARIVLPVTAKPRKRPAAPPVVDAILSGPAGAWRADRLAVATQEP